MSALKRIAVFTLGGTIASVPTKGGSEAVPTLTADALITAVPQLATVAKIEATTFVQCASGDLTMKKLWELSHAITAKVAAGFDGVVVTQGTDTLEESAFLLDLLIDDDMPVVVTGAMRNAGLAGPDGPANLLAAVQVAASPLAPGLGTLVVFADQVHLARYARKTHSAFVDTFRSPNLGPVGWVTEGNVHIPVVPRGRTRGLALAEGQVDRLPRVATLKVGIDDDLALVRGVEDLGYEGLVIEAMGGGHLPSWTVEHIAELAQRIPVVFATRTGAGQVYESTYGFPGSEKDLLDRGLIGAGCLDGNKARLLLILLLAGGASRDEIQTRFQHEAL